LLPGRSDAREEAGLAHIRRSDQGISCSPVVGGGDDQIGDVLAFGDRRLIGPL
jgi:hypothetical protein